ncbi:hypothetical protein NB713_002307 [Xanthomonas sacchari]|nr:hypothetical protein [Xanthomonas sacchari]
MRFPALLPIGQARLGLAQRFLLVFVVLLQLFQLRAGHVHRFAQQRQLGLVGADVLAEFGQRRLRLVACLVQALRQVALVLDLLFDPGQGAADFVDLGLRGAQRFGGLLATHAAGLDARLGIALLGDQLLQARLFLAQRLAQALQASVQAAVFQRLPLRILDPPLFLQRLVLLGLARLPLEVLELLADLLAQIAQALQVLAGVADAGLGLLAPLLVLGDAGGLLQVHAQVFRARLDDLADHALLDDRVAARTQAGAQEQIGDVAAPALGAVEVVAAAAVAADLALDRDLVERGVLAGDGVVGVVEDQFHRGLRHRLARRGTGKDHVRQRIAAQPAGRTFAHHPAHRVDDVRLAAAVRTDDAGHVGRQVQRGRIDEGLEAGQLDGRQAHGAGNPWQTPPAFRAALPLMKIQVRSCFQPIDAATPPGRHRTRVAEYSGPRARLGRPAPGGGDATVVALAAGGSCAGRARPGPHGPPRAAPVGKNDTGTLRCPCRYSDDAGIRRRLRPRP